jgi:hypothetical protein
MALQRLENWGSVAGKLLGTLFFSRAQPAWAD